MDIIGFGVVLGVGQAGIQEHVAVGQLGPFGPAGGAAGIEDDGRVAGLRHDGIEGWRPPVHQLPQGHRAFDGRTACRISREQDEVLATRCLLEALMAKLTHGQV